MTLFISTAEAPPPAPERRALLQQGTTRRYRRPAKALHEWLIEPIEAKVQAKLEGVTATVNQAKDQAIETGGQILEQAGISMNNMTTNAQAGIDKVATSASEALAAGVNKLNEEAAGLNPQGALQATVAYYNRHDNPLGKEQVGF